MVVLLTLNRLDVMLYRVLYWVLHWQVINPRSLVDVVQESISREVREGVIHDSGDQLGELPRDLRPHLELQCRHLPPPWSPGSHLLYNLLAVVIKKFIDGVSQQLILAVEKVVELNVDVTDPKINIKV